MTLRRDWWKSVIVAACFGLVAFVVAHQVWVFTRTYEDEEAMKKLDAWGVGYSRHGVNSVVSYSGANVSVVTFTDEVDREKMDTLLSLKHPKAVGFSNCRFTEEGMLMRIAEIPTLRSLHLLHHTVTDDDLIELLPRLTTVVSLFLQDNPITDRCVEAIASMPKLRGVLIEGTKITPEGKTRLQALRPDLRINDTLGPPF